MFVLVFNVGRAVMHCKTLASKLASTTSYRTDENELKTGCAPKVAAKCKALFVHLFLKLSTAANSSNSSRHVT